MIACLPSSILPNKSMSVVYSGTDAFGEGIECIHCIYGEETLDHQELTQQPVLERVTSIKDRCVEDDQSAENSQGTT